MTSAEVSLVECALAFEVNMQIAICGFSLFSLYLGFNFHLVLSQDQDDKQDSFLSEPALNNSDRNGNISSKSLLFENDDKDISNFTHFRLPTSVIPKHYSLRTIHILTKFSNHSSTDHVQFSAPGKVDIDVTVLQPVDNITLHAEDMKILIVKFTYASGVEIPISGHEMQNETQFLVLKLLETIPPGEYRIELTFMARIADDRLNGLYLDYYTVPKNGENHKRYLAATLFAPNHARKAFPSFDEPALRATFDIKIGHHRDFFALSNMPSITNTSDPIPIDGYPDYVWTLFQRTLPMSTYIVAMITCDFENQTSTFIREDDFSSVPLGMFAPNHLLRYSSSNFATNFALEMTKSLVPWMEGEFGRRFPLPKLDAVSLPHFYFSAMENYGLMTFKDPVLLTVNNFTTDQERSRVAEVVAHEIAHQTFGNLVTVSFWDDVWLKEGFSDFYADLGETYSNPEFHTETHFTTNSLQIALRFDEGIDTHPLHNPIKSPSDIGDIYTRISYEKGASIIRMTETFMNPEVFRRGVRLYVDRMKYKAATQEDLFKALDDVESSRNHLTPSSLGGSNNATISTILRSWTMQSGFPLIRVNMEAGGILRISQEKFVNPHVAIVNGKKDEEGNATWWVPLTFSPPMIFTMNDTKGNETDIQTKFQTTDIWLPQGQEEIFVNHDPIVVNPHSKGYYRVIYNETMMLNRIQKLLDTNHTALSPIIRSKLMDDYFALAFAKYVDVSAVLNMTRYLEAELDLVVWTSVLVSFKRIYLRLRDTTDLIHFQDYVLSKMLPALAGSQELQESAEVRRLHDLLLGHICLFKPSQCAQRAADRIRNLKQKQQPIPAHEQETLFCAFVATSSNKMEAEERCDYFLDLYHKETFSVIKGRYAKAMSCTMDPTLISRLLNLTLETELHDVDRVQLIRFVAENPVGKTMVIPFLREHFTTLYKTASVANPVTEGFKALTPCFGTSSELQELEDFIIEFHDQLGAGKRKSLKKKLREVHLNILWVEEFGEKLGTWFAKENNDKSQII